MDKAVSSGNWPGMLYLLFAFKVSNLDRKFYGLESNWLSKKNWLFLHRKILLCIKLKKPTYTLWNPVQIFLMAQTLHKEIQYNSALGC